MSDEFADIEAIQNHLGGLSIIEASSLINSPSQNKYTFSFAIQIEGRDCVCHRTFFIREGNVYFHKRDFDFQRDLEETQHVSYLYPDIIHELLELIYKIQGD